ncbi:bifunctional tryptophan synthase trp1 [Scheffersomyces spartinae]|uniref:N-(5'-phosphoribosyl)anthranilate isomerase n=1 Tax=Scheffersomyces spartinae TaxID=45513 RepID=A0A9P7V632_9ASCO|nr:bifunctional tryptophan synthase trp1 [Scheffersomyces spartinae]KAG7191958.1 bifunctional tryptophan synthase trp1 [Scheffersomyces spartinae]
MPHLVKICGLRTVEAAETAINAGADLLGVILVPNKQRTVPTEIGQQISQLTKSHQKASANEMLALLSAQEYVDTDDYFVKAKQLVGQKGPYLVGVVQNQPIDHVFEVAKEIGVDFIQLHGNERLQEYLDYNKQLGHPFGIIPRIVVPRDGDKFTEFLDTELLGEDSDLLKYRAHGFIMPLLDSEAGGEGKIIDWELVDQLRDGRYILAGGLTPYNLKDTVELGRVIGFDVSGGVEDPNGEKDLDKVKLFVKNGKSISR